MADEQVQDSAQQAAQTGESSSLLDQIVEASKLKPTDEGFSATKAGLQAFLKQLVQTGAEAKVSGAMVDDMLAEIDQKLSAQVNAIMHAEPFQKLESSWRSLKFLVDRTDFRQNIKVEFMNVSKEDLLADFEDAPEVVKSGLYKQVYTAEYGQFGGQPIGAMIANYDFGPGPQDISLLQYVASVAAMGHAPFVAAAGKEFFGIDSWDSPPFDQYAEMTCFRWRVVKEMSHLNVSPKLPPGAPNVQTGGAPCCPMGWQDIENRPESSQGKACGPGWPDDLENRSWAMQTRHGEIRRIISPDNRISISLCRENSHQRITKPYSAY